MLLLTCTIAFLGAWIGKKLKIPAGLIIGAIVAVAAANLTIGVSPIPAGMKWATQVVAGAFIGVGLNRESIGRLRFLIKPAFIIVTGLVSINVFLGLLLYHTSSLDLCTALFATVPGGIAEMSIISEDMGANTPLVSVFQIARLVSTLCTFPLFITHFMKAEKVETEKQVNSKPRAKSSLSQREWYEFLLTILFAGLSGLLGKLIGFPGGTLLFSSIAASFLQIRFSIGIIPRWSKRLAQIIVGAYVGAKVTPEVVRSIAGLLPYIVLVVVTYLIFCLFTGWFVSKVTTVDRLTASFSCTPAGSSDMALIASDFDVEPATIAVLQMIRLIMVIAICPSLISLLLKLQEILHF